MLQFLAKQRDTMSHLALNEYIVDSFSVMAVNAYRCPQTFFRRSWRKGLFYRTQPLPRNVILDAEKLHGRTEHLLKQIQHVAETLEFVRLLVCTSVL